ncbi:hypothetical protein C0R01_31270 [Streptomyces albidoflavus]|nr:hypothetical protein B9S66_30730 [Streptomyces sp. SM17]RZE54785.1 hypothetical protein C0R00_31485 [Streptomyces albidoflavus]RZE66009.1 hypothetical protein C0R01_31270 [Streptomyces albidoflavus]
MFVYAARTLSFAAWSGSLDGVEEAVAEGEEAVFFLGVSEPQPARAPAATEHMRRAHASRRTWVRWWVVEAIGRSSSGSGYGR